MARRNIPPIREAVFEAFVELPQKNPSLPPIRLPIRFKQTTREWAEFFTNLSKQAGTAADEQAIEDLFAGVVPGESPAAEIVLPAFEAAAATLAQPAGLDVLALESISVPPAAPLLGSWARHFLLMGA